MSATGSVEPAPVQPNKPKLLNPLAPSNDNRHDLDMPNTNTETHTANGTTLRLTKRQRRVLRRNALGGEVFVALDVGRQLERKGLMVNTNERHHKVTWGGGHARKGLSVFRLTDLGRAFSVVLVAAVGS